MNGRKGPHAGPQRIAAPPMPSGTARMKSESALRVHIRVVIAMLRREMSTRYGRTVGGYFWAIAEPAGMIFMLSLVFAALARKPDLGESFVVFFATGFIPFNFYRITSMQLSGAVRGNRPLLRYPNVTVYDAIVARLILQTLTNLMVAVIILVLAITVTGERVRIDFMLIGMALGAATLLAFGAGTTNAVLFHMFPLYQRIFDIVNRPLFIISGVIFIPEIMPAPIRDLLAWNPLVHLIAVFREGLYPVYHAKVNHIEYPALLGLALLFFGLLLLRRHSERLLDT